MYKIGLISVSIDAIYNRVEEPRNGCKTVKKGCIYYGYRALAALELFMSDALRCGDYWPGNCDVFFWGARMKIVVHYGNSMEILCKYDFFILQKKIKLKKTKAI